MSVIISPKFIYGDYLFTFYFLKWYRYQSDSFIDIGICSIGSGAVESTIKQIDWRLKISGAQWDKSKFETD